MVVEFDIRKPLVSKIKIVGKIQKVEYMKIYRWCAKNCGVYGHISEMCEGRVEGKG